MLTSFRSQSMEGVLIHPQKIMSPMLDELMVQQQLKAPYKRWKHMVAVMCLNLTYRKQVKTPELMKWFRLVGSLRST